LCKEGDPNPDPIRSFYQDLEKQLMTWTQEGKEIILMSDANESVGDKPGGITSIIGKAGLTDMIRFCHPHDEDINTHSRGTKQIDYIFGSAGVLRHCDRAGILPFGSGYQSDHRALFIRIRIKGILASTVQAIGSISARKLSQATPKERKIFLEEVDIHWRNQNLYDRLQKLMAIPSSEWDKENSENFERCDQQMTYGMISAEAKTNKTRTTSWSPAFAVAVGKKAFWKIALSLKITHRYPSEDFLRWAATMGVEDFNGLELHTIKQQLRQAQRELREIEQKADSLREEHLRGLLTEAELNGDEKIVQRRLQILLRVHVKANTFDN
jgi:plasmid stabilization system protein ParE